VRPIG
jgi:predicted aspartyl protease